MALIEYWWLYEGQTRRHKHAGFLSLGDALWNHNTLPAGKPWHRLGLELSELWAEYPSFLYNGSQMQFFLIKIIVVQNWLMNFPSTIIILSVSWMQCIRDSADNLTQSSHVPHMGHWNVVGLHSLIINAKSPTMPWCCNKERTQSTLLYYNLTQSKFSFEFSAMLSLCLWSFCLCAVWAWICVCLEDCFINLSCVSA